MPQTGTDFRRVRSALRFVTDNPWSGSHFFVQSTHASAGTGSGHGYSPDAPLTTIDQAIGLCTAAAGDTIHVLPGHVETVIAAAGVALDVAGVTIRGYGHGRNRPRINFTTDVAASFNISAANCRVENLWLTNAIASQTAMVNVTAADVTIKGCEFQLSDGSTATVLGILTTDPADRLLLEDNHFHGTAAVTGAIRIVGTDDTIVRGNFIAGLFATTGALEQVTTAGANHLYIRNTIINRTADGNNKAIVVKNDTTAFIVDNRLAVIDSTCPAPVTAAGGYVSHNYTAGNVGVTASVLM